MNNSELLTTKEAAKFLGISETTLYTWKCTGRYNLPVVKIGRLNKYREKDLIAFIESNSEIFLHPRK